MKMPIACCVPFDGRLLSFTSGFVVKLAIAVAIFADASAGDAQKAASKPSDGNTRLVIADYPTAQQQFEFAAKLKQSQFPVNDKVKRREQALKFIQCFEKVPANFPADQQFTPRALLEIGDCHASYENWTEATKYYKTVQSRYPDDEYLQCRARTATGRIQDLQKQYSAAKVTYKGVMEDFENSHNPDVRTLVKMAQQYYYVPHEEKVSSKGFSVKSLFKWGGSDKKN